MPRKSFAELAIKPVEAPAVVALRLPPPGHLPDAAKAVWHEIVGAVPGGFFDRASVPLLETLAIATAEHRRLSAWLEKVDSLDELAKLTRLLDAHAARISQACTRLRLTNQSRYNPRQADKAAAGVTMADRIKQNYGG